MRRFSLVAVLVAAVVVSGCAAAPPPAPGPSKPAAPTLSPAEELAWHWVGAFCSGLRDSRSELRNLGIHTANAQVDLTSTSAQRQRDQQTAAQLTASMVQIVHDNEAKVAAAPASAARDRLSATYGKLEAALTQAQRHVDQLPTTDISTFGTALTAIGTEVEAALQTARETLAQDPATKRFMAQAGTCLLSRPTLTRANR